MHVVAAPDSSGAPPPHPRGCGRPGRGGRRHLRRRAHGRWRRGHARGARRAQPHHHVTGPLGEPGEGKLRRAHRGDRDGPSLRMLGWSGTTSRSTPRPSARASSSRRPPSTGPAHVVGVGGSATTDGGLGADALFSPHRLRRRVDRGGRRSSRTSTHELFAGQKVPRLAQVELLRRRLERLGRPTRSSLKCA
jgi:hypothetical protein